MRKLFGLAALPLILTAVGCASDATDNQPSATSDSADPFGNSAQYLDFTGGTCVISGTTLTVTIPTNNVALITKRVVDSAVTVNGTNCGASAAIKKVVVNGSATAAETVIVDYTNGTFALGANNATATTGVELNLKGANTGSADKVGVKATVNADNVTGSKVVPQSGDAKYSISVNGDANPDVTYVESGTGMGQVPTPAYTVYLGDGADTWTGGIGKPISIYGGAGNDTFNQSAAATNDETMYGGAGTDTVSYALRTAAVTVDVGDVTSGVPTADDGDAAATEKDGLAADIEVVTGGGGDDSLTAVATGSTLNGGAGIDTLTGGAGADTLNGGAGDDILVGAAGADTLNGDDGNDDLTGGADNDILSGGAGDDTFDEGTASNGGDVFNGGAGVDTIDYSGRTVALVVTMDGVTADDGEDQEADNVKGDVENILGGSQGDTITGNALSNVITGNAGGDTLNGGAGDDTFDMLDDVDGNDTINGGAGIDLVDYSARTADLEITLDGVTPSGDTGNSEADTLAEIENASGGSGADTIDGNASANELIGNADVDTINGLGGDDVIDGGGQADVIDGGASDGDFCFGTTGTPTGCEF